MTQALNMLVIPGLPSYNGVEVYYLKGVIGLPIVISFRDRWYIHIFFFGNGLIDDVIVIGWTDLDFKISRALNMAINNYYLDFIQPPALISLVNDNHMDNNLKEILVFVYFGSIVNNQHKNLYKLPEIGVSLLLRIFIRQKCCLQGCIWP